MIVSMKRKSEKHSIKSGDKYGRLTVVSYTDRPEKKGEYKCVCECGEITYSRTWSLKSGKSKSCGCLMRENLSKRTKLPDNLGPIKEIYRNYKSAAERRNYKFEISIDEFKKLIESKCYYCGEKESMNPYGFHKNWDFRYNGIDRINNDYGYTINNVVPCCKICNNSKSTLTTDQFKQWIIKIYNNINKF